MSISYQQLLAYVSFALIEETMLFPIGAPIATGVQTVAIPIPFTGDAYAGAQLTVQGSNPELITVISATQSSFTATFAHPHFATDVVFGSTFPSEQPDAPLFTQDEMIQYIDEVQNDFLLKVRPLYTVSTVPVNLNQRFYGQPANCIRLERIAINPAPNSFDSTTMDLYETSQASLDMSDPSWLSESGLPAQWFRDQIDTAQYGYRPLPSSNFAAELWYSYSGQYLQTQSNLLTNLLVPDIFYHFIKYGVLARAWSKDGEVRDPDRAQYCQKRFDMGVMLAIKFMTSAGIEMPRGAEGKFDFSPMPVPQAAR